MASTRIPENQAHTLKDVRPTSWTLSNPALNRFHRLQSVIIELRRHSPRAFDGYARRFKKETEPCQYPAHKTYFDAWARPGRTKNCTLMQLRDRPIPGYSR